MADSVTPNRCYCQQQRVVSKMFRGTINLGMARKRHEQATPRPEWSKRLEAARILTGLNQTEFAKKIGMKQQRYGNYELGKRWPGAAEWRAIRNAVDTTLDILILGSHPNERSAPHLVEKRKIS